MQTKPRPGSESIRRMMDGEERGANGLTPTPEARTASYILGILLLISLPALADEPIPPGPFTETECISCHTERDPDLIRQWREDPHSTASGVGCSSCHGERHEGSAQKSREDSTCTGCHQGPTSHSYATSKHGIITRLEEGRQDWRQPLQRGNYRTPGCSYCHLHDGDHSNTMAPDRGPEVRQWICAGCHSPRYVRELFANGRRQLEIADLKLTEGESLIASAVVDQTETLSKLLQSLNHHRHNVLLGIGHQSPDYQWWHGQPALDGDLIRIRDRILQSRRRKSLADNPEE
ncbi:multiheme c-type cytochrome [endosymbiont of Lamellibrachia barhami]|uniref:multiheme c-type cytochrome n=1 Tax=endosymbiont of Lamellibrachia barhami TaxID=205975 RepID=UPI0015B04C90|nr:multiheme c-type cytochrome [endosymbiont of Lamellibrachia barhami]